MRHFVLALMLAVSANVAAAGMQPLDLRAEWLTNPVGLDIVTPRLSWRLESPERGQRQTAYQVLVASDDALLKPGRADFWDSGKVTVDETLNIAYQGKALGSGQRYVWSVRVWDRDGKASKWSAPGSWSMGFFQPADWKAQWISHRDTSGLHTNRNSLYLPPARHFRKSFASDKPVRRAVLYFSVLGLGEFHLNGERVGNALFESGWADYRQRAYCRAHDVTKLLARGENSLGAIVADGWYSGYVGYGLLVGYGPNRVGRYFYGKTPAFMAQLELEYADGSRETIVTDPTWEVSADGPFREADLIMGEAFDARRNDPNWCVPAPRTRQARGPSPAWAWEPAIPAEANGSTKAIFSDNCGEREVELGFQRPPRLQAYAAPPVRVTQELPAQRLTEPQPGVFIFDFGQNFAGNVRLKVNGPAGTRLQLRYGEMLHQDGRLMAENLRKARATDFYILRGDKDGETWTPRFTYHGFQFVEITGLASKPQLGMVTGCVLHNDTPLTSEFACSDPVMTRFWKNTQWTQRANFIEMPTDCPQRDERLGWMGDAQIYVRTASYNADVAAFFTKWLDDLVEAQRKEGPYPDYCPYPMGHGERNQTWGTAWTDAGIICPYTIWKVYGDRRLIEKNWASMTRFMDWRRARSPDWRGRKDGNPWGDWLNVNEATPIEYVDAAYFKLAADLMAEMARAVGRSAEAAQYAGLSAKIAAQFAGDYLGANGILKVNTQTAHVLALEFGLVPPGARAGIANRLEDLIAKNDYRMATGFLGTKPLLPALSGSGHHDLAVRLFQSRRFPSWGYEVEQGATSVWERWDSYTKEHGFNGARGDQNAAMNSFSHYSFGAVMQWAFQTLAGIDTDGPAFKHILIHPRPPTAGSNPEQKPVDWVQAHYDSVRGRIVSHWRVFDGRFELRVTIPPNTTATVRLPATNSASVLEGRGPAMKARGITGFRMQNDVAVFEIESGSYNFTSFPR
jgi:alpha-L-rhamnosidase